jgi:hypothetical protein
MQEQHRENDQPEERLSSDVVALCSLLARIMMRCLREKNPSMMKFLLSPPQTEQEERETGGTHDATSSH